MAGCAAKRDSYNVPALNLPGQYAKAPTVVDVTHSDPAVVDILKPKNASAPIPASSQNPASSSPLNAALAEWWRLLGSRELNGLMDRALANNPDLRIAALRIAQSKARLDQAGADKVPTITMPVQVKNEYPEFGIGRANPSGNSKSRTLHQISIRGDWRPDIWGETASLFDAAELQLLRATYQRDDIQRNVVADVVSNYAEYLSLNDRLRVARDTEKTLSEMLATMDERRAVGDATITDMEQQKGAVYQVKATIPVLEQQRVVVLNRLASLVGSVPVAMELSDSGLDTLKFPLVLPGLPSALLLRRPDVRAVEARLLAADADIDVARARVLPPLDLTAQIGYGSAYMSKLFMPQALFWEAIANLSVTIFDSGKRAREVEFAQAVHEELVETYVRVIYDAVREVDDSLSAIDLMRNRLEAQGMATDSSLRARNFSQETLLAGAIDYLVVLDTQRTYQRNLDDWYTIRMERYQGLINLFSALGGGVPNGDVIPGEGSRPAPLAGEIDYGAVLAGNDSIPEAGSGAAQNQSGNIAIKFDTALQSKTQIEGIDWDGRSLHSGAKHWLVELYGVYDRGAVLPAWRDLHARFPTLIKGRTLLPRRQGQVNAVGKERASWYRLFVATFTDKTMADEFCAGLYKGQQRCAVVSSQSLAGKEGLAASTLGKIEGVATGAGSEQDKKTAVEDETIAVAVTASEPAPKLEPVAELLAEPVIGPVAKPVSEPVAEPLVEQVVEPIKQQPVINESHETDVLRTVQGWAAAWSSKNVRDYLAYYTPDFKQGGRSHDNWIKRRTKLVNTPKVIDVALSDIKVNVQDNNHATVSFTQNYRSDTLYSQVEKTLELTRRSDTWLISKESVVKAEIIREIAQKAADANQLAQPVSGATLLGNRRFDGVDWSGQQFWLVELFDSHFHRAITSVWLDLLTRFPVQMKNRTILPRRQAIAIDGGETRPSRYQLFIAKFFEKQTAEAFCAMLRAEQQYCSVVPSQSLAARYSLNAPSATDQGSSDQVTPD